jgi:hypothetical protein
VSEHVEIMAKRPFRTLKKQGKQPVCDFGPIRITILTKLSFLPVLRPEKVSSGDGLG